MKLVVDANILFSCLIKEGKTIELFLNPFLNLYSPEFVLEEFKKHGQEILNKTHRTEKEFNKIFKIIKELITLIPLGEIEDYFKEAEKFCPDENDLDYFALALKLNCPIWSTDKKLKKQEKIKVYSTEDLVKMFKI
jgi:predicted nucleic acid-binding protein